MISVQDLSAAELAALLHFHAEAGVEWLLEDQAVDRFAEFETMQARRQTASPATRPDTSPAMPSRTGSSTPQRPATGGASRIAAAAPAGRDRPAGPVSVAIPDEQAVAQARFAAEAARSLAELRLALDGFNGCNLKNSARSTLFAGGDPGSGIMVIGPMPNADDDRDGAPFSGRAGQLFDRMLAAIGFNRSNVLLTHVIPWRPPGDRTPTLPETDICRPFIERQIALAEPNAILVLGNFTARFFFGGNETIHMMRGQWRELAIGTRNVPVLASLHPQELLTAPINKRLAWSDLQSFKARIDTLSLRKD